MINFPSGKYCFWCDQKMTKPRKPSYRGTFYQSPAPPVSPTDRTIDHVIPQSMLRQYAWNASTQFRVGNKVWCCAECNNEKGDMDPFVWAAQLGQYAIDRLKDRLVQMGIPEAMIMETIADWKPDTYAGDDQ